MRKSTFVADPGALSKTVSSQNFLPALFQPQFSIPRIKFGLLGLHLSLHLYLSLFSLDLMFLSVEFQINLGQSTRRTSREGRAYIEQAILWLHLAIGLLYYFSTWLILSRHFSLKLSKVIPTLVLHISRRSSVSIIT